MNDIRVESNGDLSITDSFDISLLSSEELITSLVQKAIETPKYYLARYSSENNVPYIIDLEFGDNIYSRMSEPTTLSLLENIKLDIQQALSYISNEITIDLVEVDLLAEYNQVTVKVSYTVNNSSQVATLTI